MVPHSLETEEKMKCLYYLYACLDTNAVRSEPYSLSHLDCCDHVLIFFPYVKRFYLRIPTHRLHTCMHTCILTLMNGFISRALNEMWKCQNMLRGLVKELLDLHKLPVVRLLLTN